MGTPANVYQREAWRVTLVGSVVDLGLGIVKIGVGLMAQSQALVADGIHSLSDLVTDIGVLVVTRYAGEQPDAEHPYGHERFETLASWMLGAVLLMVAGGIVWDSVERLWQGQVSSPGPLALGVALLSIASKEWIFRFTRRVAERLRSSVLLANAWHSRTDALSSVAVLVGVAGAMAGWAWMDLLAALVVAGMVGWIGWSLILRSSRELVDTGLSPQQTSALRIEVLSVPGVVGVHGVRSRRMGQAVLLDLDILVAPQLSVSEGHQIASQVQRRLRGWLSDIRDVKIHVDSDTAPTRADLPWRGEAERLLLERWSPLLGDSRIQRLTLHYSSEGISVDVHLYGEVDEAMPASLQRSAADLPWLHSVQAWTPA